MADKKLKKKAAQKAKAKKASEKKIAKKDSSKKKDSKKALSKAKDSKSARKSSQKKTKTNKKFPSDSDIALRAYGIYQDRCNRGEPGDEHSDWLEALRQLGSS